MEDSKFIALLKTLKTDEEKSFYKYLKQVHGDKEAFPLYVYLRKFYPEFEDGKKLDVAYAYHVIHKININTQKSGRKSMLNDLSKLYGYLKEFLIVNSLGRSEGWVEQVLWLDILRTRKQKEEFVSQAGHFYAKTEGKPKKSIEDYFKLIAANYFQYHLLTLDKSSPQTALKSTLEAMETYGETIRLKLACEILNRNHIHPSANKEEDHKTKTSKSGRRRDNTAIEPPPPTVTNVSKADLDLLALYREIYTLLESQQQSDDQQYDKVETILRTLAKTLIPSEFSYIFRYMYNYAATQIRRGQEAKYSKKLHDLNVLWLEHGFSDQDNPIISPAVFNNIVNVACTAGQISWAQDFIRQKNHLLDAEERPFAVAVAQAIIALETGKTHEAYRLLHAVQIKDPQERIRVRCMTLRIYYDLEEYQGIVEAYCNSFHQMLRRYEQPYPPYVLGALGFTSIVRVLLFKNINKQQLLQRIEKEEHLYYRSWLLEKMKSYVPLKTSRSKKQGPSNEF